MISPIEDIIAEARAGRPFILVDAEDRENEGDIVIPAQFATAARVNFMAMHARGLICLAITEERARTLRLAPMTAQNGARHSTAFTVSVEAREGVTTGISAHDRARTISVAIDPERGADDLASPGHVFPLVARDGGVLVRAGHTEAAVDIARLAGLIPAGVICEVMNDDGTMARLPELSVMAQQNRLKIGAIADLIQHRRRTERTVERVLETPFESEDGLVFRMVIYRHLIDGTEHVALVNGAIGDQRPALVRVHSMDLATDLFRRGGPRANYIPQALRLIGEHDGPGVLVCLRDSRLRWSERYSHGLDKARASLSLREYGLGAQILRDLGVGDMILLTQSPARMSALEGYGLRVVASRSIEPLKLVGSAA